MTSKLQRKALSLHEKHSIIDIIEKQEKSGLKPNYTQIAKQFGSHRTTIGQIAKNRDVFKTRAKADMQSPSSKRFRPFKHDDVDEALHIWTKQKLDQDARMNLPFLKAKATMLAEEMGFEFEPTDSWLNRFKTRHGLRFKRDQGEQQNVDNDAAEYFLQNKLPAILDKYSTEDIYNTDETGLYYRGLPDRGYAHISETLSGAKKAKDRITVLLTANMTGLDKREPLVIGKSKKPRGFPRDHSKLPVKYRNSSNAWMTSDIFRKHLSAWNSSLRFQKRKIALLMDNCSALPTDMKFSNIEVIFLPPNTTSKIQPLDMGVIKNLKGHYRTDLNKRIINELDADPTTKASVAVKNIRLIDSIYMLKDAWAKVTPATFANCFAHAGFKTDNEQLEELNVNVPTPENLSDEVFQDFFNIDQDLEICGELTDTEITQDVKRRRLCTDDTDHETDEDDDLPMPVASRKDVNTALQTLRSFLQMNSMESSRLDLKNIEASIMDHYKTKATQRSITHFFPSSQKSITVSSPPSPTLSIDYDSYPDPPSPTESVTFYNFYPESSSP